MKPERLEEIRRDVKEASEEPNISPEDGTIGYSIGEELLAEVDALTKRVKKMEADHVFSCTALAKLLANASFEDRVEYMDDLARSFSTLTPDAGENQK